MIGSLLVIGPGRLGTAIARLWCDAGMDFRGFVGRDAARTLAALQFCGRGAPREISACGDADVVLIAVGDGDLQAVVAEAREFVRPDSVWLHASGFHDLAVLGPLADRGALIGALHPLCPIPDPSSGVLALAGAPATIAAVARAMPVLHELAERAGLRPLRLAPGADRRRYHAACALAANGATALHAAATELLAEGLQDADAGSAATALMQRAIELCATLGAQAALSGPVLRGDRVVVGAHLDALADDPALSVYRALMVRALDLAKLRGSASRESLDALGSMLGPARP